MVETTFRSGRMNERIDELMIEAGARFEFLHGVHYDDFQYEKFAELIVQECIDIISPYTVRMSRPGEEYLHPIQEIKKNFGIEQ